MMARFCALGELIGAAKSRLKALESITLSPSVASDCGWFANESKRALKLLIVILEKLARSTDGVSEIDRDNPT